MDQSALYRIATIVSVLIVISFGFFFFYRQAGEGNNMASTTSPTATSTVFLPGAHTKGGVTGSGDFTVEAIPTLKTPDFRAPLTFSTDVSAEVRAIMQQRVTAVQALLAKNSTDLKAWLDLGAIRKMAGDYKGAETAWKFVAEASPKNTAAFWNLGDLYTNFIKDYPKAETNFKKVVALEPHSAAAYVELASLYTNFYKQGTSATEDILKTGIAANPDTPELHITLARYYKSHNRTPDAQVQYEAALQIAIKQNNQTLIAQIKSESGE